MPFSEMRQLPGWAGLGLAILALGGLIIGANVFTWHLPVLIVVTALAAYFLYTGQLKPWHGYTLLAFYAVYWIVGFAVFGTVPVETD